METYKDLCAIFLDDAAKKRHNTDYSILVRANGIDAHTAFYSEKDFKQWMEERHLTIGEKFPYSDNSYRIIGEYKKEYFLHIHPILPNFQNMHNCVNWTGEDLRKFGESNGLKEIRIVDNGELTTGFVFHDIDGLNFAPPKPVTIIYLLNPNCKRETWK